MKVRLIKHVDTTEGRKGPGHEIEHPDAWRLCCLEDQHGRPAAVADALDDEAKTLVAEWTERRKAKIAERLRLEREERDQKAAEAQAKAAKKTEAFAKKLEA